MSNVHLSTSGPGETIIDAEDGKILAEIEAAKAQPADLRRDALAKVVASYPASLHAWAALGANAYDVTESYAAYRVGYHRGLDALRKSGWRGSGFVRWQHSSNHGFLNCLKGLAAVAQQIGETDEAQRCAVFLGQLDPSEPNILL